MKKSKGHRKDESLEDVDTESGSEFSESEDMSPGEFDENENFEEEEEKESKEEEYEEW